MKTQSYTKYKDSNIDWLGDIPNEWEIKKLKYLAKIVTGNTPPKADEDNYSDSGFPWIKPDGLGSFEPIEDSHEKLSEQGAKLARIIPKGAILVCGIGSVGKYGLAGSDLTTNQQVNSLIFNEKINSKFGFYLIVATEEYCKKYATTVVVSILNTFRQGQLPYPIPQINDQIKIANYLDRKIKQIDELIKKNGKLIELLLEKRQAIISQAVTKGLSSFAKASADKNPKAKMKDSGISWLGEIPENWALKKLKFIAKINMGQSPSSEDCNTDGIGIPFLQGNGEFGSVHPSAEQFCENPNKIANEHDILLSVRAPVGELNVADQSYGIGRGLCSITPNKEVADQNYLWYSLMVLRMELSSLGTGSTYNAVSVDEVRDLLTIRPDLPEQKLIAEYINKKMDKIDELVQKIKLQNQKLQEFRQALISNVVTGKIRV